jgi:hypothetical protein
MFSIRANADVVFCMHLVRAGSHNVVSRNLLMSPITFGIEVCAGKKVTVLAHIEFLP